MNQNKLELIKHSFSKTSFTAYSGIQKELRNREAQLKQRVLWGAAYCIPLSLGFLFSQQSLNLIKYSLIASSIFVIPTTFIHQTVTDLIYRSFLIFILYTYHASLWEGGENFSNQYKLFTSIRIFGTSLAFIIADFFLQCVVKVCIRGLYSTAIEENPFNSFFAGIFERVLWKKMKFQVNFIRNGTNFEQKIKIIMDSQRFKRFRNFSMDVEEELQDEVIEAIKQYYENENCEVLACQKI